MIVRAIATDELNDNIKLLVRLESALYPVNCALAGHIKSDERDTLNTISDWLQEMIAALRREMSLS